MSVAQLDIQGHRGCRGLYPENSIPAFLHAIELGVHTLEFDVVISKDKKVIVSHEPFMSHEICTTPDGSKIEINEESKHNLYQLSYDEIKSYDCGSLYFEKFPDQEKLKTYKPSLKDVVDAVNNKLNSVGISTINYNIEIKRKAKWDNTFHPEYHEFADLVIAEIEALGIMDKTTVQCFDVPTLQYIHETYPNVRLVYLIYNQNGIENNLELLGFNPAVYSPYHGLIKAGTAEYCKERQIQLIPWTVNEVEDMQKMIDRGVDGIITDYPDRLIELTQSTTK
ncbi:MAG: glycerophosphodiester phosphodiesterase [Saprospiraceae bacterium]|nr:glycerophosphodiester phosphodiesterase [Saprospiraceae bacterium]